MSSFTYRGPADNLLLPKMDRAYHIGDAVPLSKAQKEALEVAGHRFDDSDEAEIARATEDRAAALTTDTAPRGDRGEVLDIPDAKKGAETPEPPVAPTPSARSS